MKRNALCLGAAFFLCGVAPLFSATVLVNDTFDVGITQNNDVNDPLDTSWTAFQGGTLTITNDGVFSGRSLDANPGTTAARGLNGSLPGLVNLGVGETLSFSFKARIINPEISTTNTFRFGLFSGVDSGYAVYLPLNAAGTMTIQVDGPPDVTPGDANPASGGDVYSIGSAPFSGIFDTGIYAYSLSLTRSAASQVDVLATVNGVAVTGTHLTPTNGFLFDRVIIRSGPNAANTNRFRIDDVLITHTEVTPKIQFASTYGSSNTVSVHFNRPVTADTAENVGSYSYTDGANTFFFIDARFVEGDRLVVLTAGANFTPGTRYTLYATDIQDTLGNLSTPENGTATFQQVAGRALFEQYLNISGGAFPVVNAEKFTNTAPDIVSFRSNFTWSATGNMADAWLGRLTTYFIPPSNGTYRFYLRSDDSSRLYLNTNAANSTDPSAKTRIALLNANRSFYTNWPSGDLAVSPPITLTGGQRYYLEALLKEGSQGDNVFVTVRDNNTLTNPPSAEVINTNYLELPVGAASVTTITPAAVTNAQFATMNWPRLVAQTFLSAGCGTFQFRNVLGTGKFPAAAGSSMA